MGSLQFYVIPEIVTQHHEGTIRRSHPRRRSCSSRDGASRGANKKGEQSLSRLPEALYRPMRIAPHFRRGAQRSSETALEEELSPLSPGRVQIPDGEYKAACRWVCSGGVCELYC